MEEGAVPILRSRTAEAARNTLSTAETDFMVNLEMMEDRAREREAKLDTFFCTSPEAGSQRQHIPDRVHREQFIRDQVYGPPKMRRHRSVSELEYNGLYDPTLKNYFSKPSVREHLLNKGFVTKDGQVLGSTQELHHFSKAQRLLQEREEAQQKVNERKMRLRTKLLRSTSEASGLTLPPIVQWSVERTENRRQLKAIRTLKQKMHVQDTFTDTVMSVQDLLKQNAHRHKAAETANRERKARAAMLEREEALRTELIKIGTPDQQKEARLRDREAELRRKIENEHLAVDRIQPKNLQHALQQESEVIKRRMTKMQNTEWKEEMDARLAAEMAAEEELLQTRRQEKQRKMIERTERIRQADQRRYDEAAQLRHRREKAQREHDAMLAKRSQASDEARQRREALAKAAHEREVRAKQADWEELHRAELEEQRRILQLRNDARRAALMRQAAQAPGRDAIPLIQAGWTPNWLELKFRMVARLLDVRRTNRLPWPELLRLVTSPALGLQLSDGLRAALVRSAPPIATDGTVDYTEWLPTVEQTMSNYFMKDENLFIEAWTEVYDPSVGICYHYNMATKVLSFEPPQEPKDEAITLYTDSLAEATTGSIALLTNTSSKFSPVEPGAMTRAILQFFESCEDRHRPKTAGPGKYKRIDEEHFLLLLQSSVLGLGLSLDECDLIAEEFPPDEDGAIDFDEIGAEIGQVIQQVYIDLERDASRDWCMMHSAEDGLFYFNKASSELAAERPAEMLPRLHDGLIEDFIHQMFKPLDIHQTGNIDDDTFWDMLENSTPGGLGLSNEESFAIEQRFDHAADDEDSIPYHQFAPLVRPLMHDVFNVPAPHDRDWIKLTIGGRPFYFNRNSSETRLTDPRKYSADLFGKTLLMVLHDPVNAMAAKLPELIVAITSINKMATEEEREASRGPAYAPLTNRFPSTIGLFCSSLMDAAPTVTATEGAAEAVEVAESTEKMPALPADYASMSQQYPSMISSYAPRSVVDSVSAEHAAAAQGEAPPPGASRRGVLWGKFGPTGAALSAEEEDTDEDDNLDTAGAVAAGEIDDGAAEGAVVPDKQTDDKLDAMELAASSAADEAAAGAGTSDSSAAEAEAPAEVPALAPALPDETAKFSYEGRNEKELTFVKGAVLQIDRNVNEHWLHGACDGASGLIPKAYLEAR